MSNMHIALKIPTEVHHFHNKSGKRLLATIMVARSPDQSNELLVGIARASKRERRPSRLKGRVTASERLMRGMGIYDNPMTDPVLAMGESAQHLFVKMTDEQFENMVKDNPFAKFGCPFGATKEEMERLEKHKKQQKKLAKKRRALRQDMHKKALKEVRKIREAKKEDILNLE